VLRGPWARALAVFALALALRVAFLRVVPQPAAGQLDLYAEDSVHYVAVAQGLLAGHGYSFWGGPPDAYVSPGYPVFLAAVFHLFPASPLGAVRLAQAVLGAATAALAAGWVGLLAGVLVALYPPFIWSTGSILTEVLFLFLLMAYLALHARLLAAPRGSAPRWVAAGAGVMAGLAILTRPEAAALPLVIGALVYLRRRLATGLGTLLLAAAVVNLPWWIRNLVVLHRLILFATQAANPLLGGLLPGGAQVQAPPGSSPYAFALAMVWAQLHTDPRAFLLWMTIGHWGAALSQPYAGGTLNGGFLQGLAAYQQLFCWVGAAGLVFAAIFRPRLRVAVLAAAVFMVLLSVFIPSPRYAYPLMAMLAIGAGALLSGLLSLTRAASG